MNEIMYLIDAIFGAEKPSLSTLSSADARPLDETFDPARRDVIVIAISMIKVCLWGG